MKGSVVRKTDASGKARYYVIIEQERPDGSRRRKWHTDPATGSGFTRKAAAEEYAAHLVVAKSSNRYVEPARTTFGEYAHAWLQRAQDRLKPSTWASYEKNLRVHILPTLGELRVQSITAQHLDDLYAQLRRDGKQVKGHDPAPLARRTVHYCHVIIKAILSDAVRRGALVSNPANGATPPSAKPAAEAGHTFTTWTASDVATFMDRSAQHRYGPIFAFLALTGARRGEALGLRWSQVDVERRRAAIVTTVGRVGGRIIEGATKTGAGRRPIALDPVLVAVLDEQHRRQDHDKHLLGAGYRDDDLVFATPTGGYLNPENVSRVFVSEVDRLGLPMIRLHDLRHTWATLALQTGVHPRVVQERLGHANVNITLQTYSHVTPLMHEDAAATVSNLISASRDANVTPLRPAR